MTSTFIALDPSLRNTGWVVFDAKKQKPIAASVIVTRKSSNSRLTAQEKMTGSTIELYKALRATFVHFRPSLVFAEGASGSKSLPAAASLAASQAVVAAATQEHLGTPPIYFTQQALKKALSGRVALGKEEIQAGVEAAWPAVDWHALFEVRPPHAPPQWRALPKSKYEHAYDAAACGYSALMHPLYLAFLQAVK